MLLTRRIGRKRIQGLIEECTIVAGKQLEWIQKYQETLATVETPSLVSLEYILKEGNRVPCKCPEIDSLRLFISRAKDWIDAVKRMLAKRVTPEHATYSSERSFENIIFLKAEGFRLCFDCPELSLLHTFCGELESFTQKTKELLTQASVAVVQMSQVPTILTQLNEMLLTGQEYTLTTAFPILSDISSKIKELEWVRRCYFCLECDNLDRASSLQILPDFETVLILLDEGRDSGARSDHPLVALLRRYKQSGDKWNLKAASLLKQKYISLPELNEILAEMVGVPVIAEYHVKLKNLLSMVIDWKDRVKNQFGFSLQKNEDEMEDVDDGRIRSSRATSGGGDASTEIALLGYKMVFSDTPILLNLHQDPTAPPPPHQPHLPITSFTPPSQPSPCSIEDVKKLIAELDEIPVSRVDEVVVLREWVKKVDDWSTKCKRVFMRGTAQRTLSELLKEVLLNVKTCCTEVANQEVIVEEEKGKYCICGFASQGFMVKKGGF